MTKISPTEREPLCDIEAQFRALLDPDHPKRALWVSAGTPSHALAQFALADGFCRLELPQGTLYASEHDCGRLEDEPTEERLAELLDYIETKSAVQARPALWWIVIQARDARDCVVWEQVASWEGLREAQMRGLRYGRLVILTMDGVLARRKLLIAQEEANAQRLQGRPGREQAQG